MSLFATNFTPSLASLSHQDNGHSDDVPVIAVMVALSSLLVIIFIIIILYMLRLVKRSYALRTTHRLAVKA